MATELLVKYILTDSTAPRIVRISHCQTIGQLIAFIARTQGVDVGIVSVDGCILNNDDPLDAFYDSPNIVFHFFEAREPVPCQMLILHTIFWNLPVLHRNSRIPTV
jgi:hypothetical protein